MKSPISNIEIILILLDFGPILFMKVQLTKGHMCRETTSSLIPRGILNTPPLAGAGSHTPGIKAKGLTLFGMRGSLYPPLTKKNALNFAK